MKKLIRVNKSLVVTDGRLEAISEVLFRLGEREIVCCFDGGFSCWFRHGGDTNLDIRDGDVTIKGSLRRRVKQMYDRRNKR